MKEEILKFFDYLNMLTKLNIISLELTPIHLKDNIYACGLCKTSTNDVKIHLQEIKHINLNGTQIKGETENELYVNIELLTQDTIRTTFNSIRDEFYKLDNYDVIYTQYGEATSMTPVEEYIIFNDKHNACKYIVKLRKKYKSTKTKIIHFGTQNKQITDEEFAEAPMEEDM